MIFSIGNHIQKIIDGTKTQTRRKSGVYMIGQTYSIQPCRNCKGILEGRIRITDKNMEARGVQLHETDAIEEGEYNVKEFEELYEKMYPMWTLRWAYRFEFVPRGLSRKVKK